MISPKYDSNYIEQELRNSRRLVEKSIEFSKRYTPTDSSSNEKISELLEKLRNEEYLKSSYEKALKENLLILKEEQKKNLFLEQKVESLERKILELNDSRFFKVLERVEDLESQLRRTRRSSCEPQESKRNGKNSVSLAQASETDRIETIRKKVENIEKALKREQKRSLMASSKSMKSIVRKKK